MLTARTLLLSLFIASLGGVATAQQSEEQTAVTKSIYKENNELNIRIYPNPCTSEFSVQYDCPEPGQAEVRLMDINYQTISLRNHELSNKGTVSFDFDVTALPSGFYFVHVATREGMSTLKFLKQ